MNELAAMIWVETRKVLRSRIPWFTAAGSLLMPLGIAFLIFVATRPDVARRLGLVAAKANLVSYARTDWSTYLMVQAQMVAAGGFFLFSLLTCWVFGREFVDGTLKDLLAVPVQRGSIVLAKFVVAAIWSALLAALTFATGLLTGALMQLPQASPAVLLQGAFAVTVTACLVIAVVLPFALFASIGRGYLLPIGLALVALMLANMIVVLGLGDYFPWAVPGLYAQGKTALGPVSYAITLVTGVVGVIATYLWWKYADQPR